MKQFPALERVPPMVQNLFFQDLHYILLLKIAPEFGLGKFILGRQKQDSTACKLHYSKPFH